MAAMASIYWGMEVYLNYLQGDDGNDILDGGLVQIGCLEAEATIPILWTMLVIRLLK